MDAVAVQTSTAGEIVFPIISLGTLLIAVLIFGFFALQDRSASVSWSIFSLLLLSIGAVGLDAATLFFGGFAGQREIALELNRLFELSTTAFAAALPFALWAALPAESSLRSCASGLGIVGVGVTLLFAVIAFAAPERFVSVTTEFESYLAYSSSVGRGLRGDLFRIRDAILGVSILGTLSLSAMAIVRREITGVDTLSAVGLMLGALNATSTLYANFVGRFPGPLATLRFSRVGLSIMIFTLTATAAYVLRFFRQSRALDIANRELERSRDRVAYLAYHNAQTRMPNKQALIRDVDGLLANQIGESKGGDHPFAEAFICDLDSFSSVEESYGYSFSASLLTMVGRRIERQLLDEARCSATVYHIEGDRFAILLPCALGNADRSRLERMLIREIATPVSLEGQEVFLSGGLGHCPIAPDAGDAEEVLRRLKRGLSGGAQLGSRVGRYSPEMSEAIEASRKLVQDLRRAIRDDDFHVHYQPIVDRDGRVCSCEALLRWDRADTERFIALAEQSGLIVPITEFVVHTVCADLELIRQVSPGISIHINISARHITQIGFPEVLTAAVSRLGLEPSALAVEITETSFLKEESEVAAVLKGLNFAGFAVAIDDFGSGYSSMNYLKQIPAAEIKIDRSFVQGLPSGREDRALVDSMILLAHDLGKRVIAEGVETAEQARYLLDAGVDCLQGYHFARPMSREAFVNAINTRIGPPDEGGAGA